MPLTLILACFWALAAFVAGLAPGRFHWPAAYVLIATGFPIVGYVGVQAGPLWGLAVLGACASVLRWPLIFAGRWLRRRVQV